MSQYLNLKPVEFSSLSAKALKSVTIKGRIALPKYDGCFVMFLCHNGKVHGVRSRDNKPVLSMGHIERDLPLVYPELFAFPFAFAVLGEAWSPSMEFKENSGAFRRHSQQDALGFAPFDVVQWDGELAVPKLFDDRPYRERLEDLAQERRKQIATNIFTPIPMEVESMDTAIAYARHLKKAGSYDGAVIADPNAPYVVSNGSKGEFIKIKPLLSHSLEVVGVVGGIGEKTGRPTGALIVRWKDGRTFKVGTGLSEHEQANIETFIGKVVEVTAMGEYEGGALREPRYMGTRDDAKAEF